MTDRRRALPSVDALLRDPLVAARGAGVPRTALVRAARDAVAEVREGTSAAPDGTGWADAVGRHLERHATPSLRPCINATGVVLHTNLGRAPLADAARRAIAEAATGYGTLEFDLETGGRGDRQRHVDALLAELTGAEDALAVNNCASALVLALNTAAAGGGVVVSRGELIEIGGGFRIPEIIETAGTRLIEVGTTNRTRLEDYAAALRRREPARSAGRTARTAPGVARRPPPPDTLDARAILKVHRSNFRLEGFVAEASLADLVALGRTRRRPVIYDLGGGLMLDPGPEELKGEPTLPEAARTGATAVVASGDKLLGGPQAGILVGRKGFLARCRRNPLARAVRADKLTLAGLAATLRLYRDSLAARREIPVLRMLAESQAAVAERARLLAAALPAAADPTVVATRAAVGGGAFPGVLLPSAGVSLDPGGRGATALAERLRRAPVPVVAVVARGRVILDLRTVLPGEEELLARSVEAALG
jgi:L-seryl-tRNA(Ser) seleniumtransferase